MTIFSLYIFDRHCECVYYQDWHRTKFARIEGPAKFKPNVHRLPGRPSQSNAHAHAHAQPTDGPKESIFDDQVQGSASAVVESKVNSGVFGRAGKSQSQTQSQGGLPFDEESKLVYGVILSLRNMVKKLSGRDEAFTSYSTSSYKLHLYETLTGYKFVLLSDPSSDSLRFVLRQLYIGPFIEYVVRNPLVQIDSRKEGVDNDQFRTAVDKHMRSLSMFGS